MSEAGKREKLGKRDENLTAREILKNYGRKGLKYSLFCLCHLILWVLKQDSLAFSSASGDLYFLCSGLVKKRRKD